MYQMRKWIYIFMLSGIASYALALPNDTTQTMHIVADASSFNYHTGMSQYDGNVHITQGAAQLTADRLITHNNSSHKIQEAIAYGFQHQAEYWTRLKANDPLLHAIADVIHFYPQKSLVILEGNAKVVQGDNTFDGPVIIYNIQKQTVTAPPSKLGRATVVINPDNPTS